MSDSLEELSVIEKERSIDKLIAETEQIKRQSRRSKIFDPLSATILVAAIGLLGNVAVTIVNGSNEQRVEQIKNDSALILEAIKTGKIEIAKANIKFFLDAGLIDNKNEILAKALEASVPVLPVQSQVQTQLEPCPTISKEVLTANAPISLHFGTNTVDKKQYEGWSGELTAAEFDALDMAAVAASFGYVPNIRIKTLDRRECMLKDLADLAEQMQEGGALFLTYSGHAGQVPDYNGDESLADQNDTLDETLALYDGQLLDDEMVEALRKFKKGVRIVVAFDSMNFSLDEIKSDPQVLADVIVINGAGKNQVALDGLVNGLFTTRMLELFRADPPSMTYAELQAELLKRMPPDQTPSITVERGSSSLMSETALRPQD